MKEAKAKFKEWLKDKKKVDEATKLIMEMGPLAGRKVKLKKDMYCKNPPFKSLPPSPPK